MNVDVSNEKLNLQLAFRNVKEGKFSRALEIFGKIDSYPAALNRILCLCAMGELSYAQDEYRKACLQYSNTNKVHWDVYRYSPLTEHLISPIDEDLPINFLVGSNCESVDPELIPDYVKAPGSYFVIANEEMRDTVHEALLGAYGEMGEFKDEYFDDQIYDPNSPVYHRRLAKDFATATGYNETTRIAKYGKKLARIQYTTDPFVLVKMAEHFMRVDDPRNAFVVVRALYEVGVSGTDVAEGGIDSYYYVLEAIDACHTLKPRLSATLMKYFLNLMIAFGEPSDLRSYQDFVYYASEVAKDSALAFKLAREMQQKYQNVAVDPLKQCICAYYNAGEYKLAHDTAIDLNRLIPGDVFAIAFFGFERYGSRGKGKAKHIPVPFSTECHWYLPDLFLDSVSGLISTCLFETLPFTRELGIALMLLADYARMLVCQDDEMGFSEISALFDTVVKLVPIDSDDSKAAFIDFATTFVYAESGRSFATESVLLRLLEIGYRGELLVTMNGGGANLLFLEYLPQELPMEFMQAFAHCASLCKVSAKRAWHCYTELRRYPLRFPKIVNYDYYRKRLAKHPETSIFQQILQQCANAVRAQDRSIAYFILSHQIKGFENSPEAELFTKREKKRFAIANSILDHYAVRVQDGPYAPRPYLPKLDFGIREGDPDPFPPPKK